MTTITAAQAATREAHRHEDGEFGTQTHGDPGVVTISAANMGDVTNIHEGSRTPWGQADQVDHAAPGIVFCSTPSHGGFKLSPQRNAMVPAALRQKSGWYEEDCESNIVGWIHPEAYPHLGNDIDALRADFEDRTKAEFPDEYEAATGIKVALEESYELRQRAARADVETFRAEHAADMVTTGQNSGSHTWTPDGYELVETERRTTGEKQVLMVRKGFWDRNGTHSTNTPIVMTKAENAVDVTSLAGRLDEHYRTHYRPQMPKRHDVTTDYSGLSEAARVRADRELTKLYRLPDGGTGSIVDYFNQVGVTGKAGAYYSGDTSPSYRVELGESRVHRVSKAAYDALTNIPDSSSDVDRAAFEVGRIQASVDRAEKAIANYEWNGDFAKARAKADALRKQLSTARQAQTDIEKARQRPTDELRGQLKAEAAELVADRTPDTDI